MNVLIRTDASVRIGSGHVMRTLALAEELRRKGDRVTFITRAYLGNMNDFLKNRKNFPVISLGNPSEDTFPSSNRCEKNPEEDWLGISWEEDLREVKEKIKPNLNDGRPVDWLVVDHYSLDLSWESSLRVVADKVMVIDDMADRKHDADLLLDQNLYKDSEKRYDGLVSRSCRKLLGPRFALLRPEFLKARKFLREREGQIKRIMIFFGGSDPGNETMKALKAFSYLDVNNLEIDVVVGSANRNVEVIHEYSQKNDRIHYHFNIDYIAKLMVESDLFIGSGGTSTWERCCLGLPSIIVAVEKNQEDISSNIDLHGMGLYLGTSKNVDENQIAEKINLLIQNPDMVRDISKECLHAVDGMGVSRVTAEMINIVGV